PHQSSSTALIPFPNYLNSVANLLADRPPPLCAKPNGCPLSARRRRMRAPPETPPESRQRTTSTFSVGEGPPLPAQHDDPGARFSNGVIPPGPLDTP